MSPREAGARRRRGLRVYAAVVLAWTVTFLTAVVLLPPGAHTIAVAHADSSSVTVQGPPVWDPSTQTSGPNGSVTVSQTQNLVNQRVHVSWTGFTPSTGGTFISLGNQQNSLIDIVYPVVVYECKGTNPKITDCYGSWHYGQGSGPGTNDGFGQLGDAPGTLAPDFPSNEQAAITDGTGSGSLDLEVYTSSQAPTLGCDATHQCSLVVEPNYGGDALGYDTNDGSAGCTDHSQDAYAGGEATDITFGSYDVLGTMGGEQCAWHNRTVIPLSFAPVPDACAAGTNGLAAEGQPSLDRALTQWVVGACLAGGNPVSVTYDSGQTEPAARADFLAGGSGADLAFTSLPADPTVSSTRPYTYVPVASHGIAVAFNVDDTATNLPITSMKLNARLVAKLLTQSYDFEHIPTLLSDTASVAGNPMCLYDDPEFQKLNPSGGGVTWPLCPAVSGPDTLPIVTGGKTDLVRELTTWIMDDPDARAFLAGQPDPWGMHVDTFYETAKYPYPIDSFVPQDSSGPPLDPQSGGPYDPTGPDRDYNHLKGFEWTPIQSGLDDVLRHLLTETPTCIGPSYDKNVTGGHAKCAAEFPGASGVLAIMDTGRAAAFNLPTAALLNGAGEYVAPTTPALASAALDYLTDPKTGTQSLPWGVAHTGYAGDAAAYPLTIPDYAMAPTSGVSGAKAAQIADFLGAVTDNRSGQFPGTAPGELAPGYVPNTPDQEKQAGAAVAAIRLAGPGVTATGPPSGGATSTAVVTTPVTVIKNGTTSTVAVAGAGNGGGGGNPVASGSTPASSSKAGAVSTSAPLRSLSGSTTPAAAVGTASADRAGAGRLVLPVLLIIGLVLVAAGPTAFLLTAPGGVGARIRGLRLPQRPKRRFGK